MHSLFSCFSIACRLLFHWLRFFVSLLSSVVHHLFSVIVSLSFSLRCSVVYCLFSLFSRFLFSPGLFTWRKFKKLFKTKRVVGYVISRLKTRVSHTLSRQNKRAAHTLSPTEKYIFLLSCQIWGGNVQYSGFIFSLFLRTFCKLFSRPTDYVELLLVFLLKYFHPLCKCSVAKQTFSNGSRETRHYELLNF